jgi:hypothetical protein
VGSESQIPQVDDPDGFLDFAARDCNNTTENVFVKASDLVPGRYVIKVIGFAFGAAAVDPAYTTSTEALPNWNDNDGDLTHDTVTAQSQGYALVASGKIAKTSSVTVLDGCHPDEPDADGMLDVNEVVSLRVALTAETFMPNVTGCLEAADHSVGGITVGGFGPDFAGPEQAAGCAVYGELAAGQTAHAHFPVMLLPSHPLPPFALEARFVLQVMVDGQVQRVEPFSVPIDPAYSTLVEPALIPAAPGANDCTLLDDPVLRKDGADLRFEYCEGFALGAPPSDSYNVYVGRFEKLGWTRTLRGYDHVSDPPTAPAALCNLPCDDGVSPDPDPGRCDFVLPNEVGDGESRYYLIGGEVECTAPGQGLESVLGFNTIGSGGTERHYGGGSCP